MSEMSMSAYAAHAGVDRKTVTRWVKEGKYIVMAGKKIDVESSDANLRKYRDRTDPRVRNAKSKKTDEPTIGNEGCESAEAIYDGLVTGRTTIRPIEESRAIKEHTVAAIQSAVDEVFFDNGEPGGKVFISDLNLAIGAISGTRGFVLNQPSGVFIQLGAGELPVRGEITFSRGAP